MTRTAKDCSPWVRHRTLLLAVLGVLLYLPFLGLRDLWYADEPDIAEVCRTMFLSGDWIAPRRLGLIWVDYPPMIYWAGSAASHLLRGMSEFALRLPNALASIGMVLLSCGAASRWFGARAGLWAGFMLLTCLQFVHQAISYRPDVLFGLFITAGILVYARGAGERPRLLLRVAGFALLGLAMLSKGPLGLLLPGLVLFLWHGSRREWRRLFELAPLALVSLAVYLPWFVACGKAMGADSIVHEFYAQNIARFFGGNRGHVRPFYYYLTQFWVDLAPWSILAPFAVAWVVRGKRRGDRNVQLLLWWFGAFFVFLSIAVTKRHLYLLPAYPAMAMLMAPWLADVGRQALPRETRPPAGPLRFYAGFFAVVAALVALILFAATAFQTRILERVDLYDAQVAVAATLRAPLVVLGLILLAGALGVLHARHRGDLRAVLLRAGLTVMPLVLVLSGWVMPLMNPIKTYRPESLWIQQQIGSEEWFGLVGPSGNYYGKAGAFGYYSGALIEYLPPDAAEVDRFLDEHPGSLVLVHENRVEELFAGDEARWRARVLREMPALHDHFLVVGRGRSG